MNNFGKKTEHMLEFDAEKGPSHKLQHEVKFATTRDKFLAFSRDMKDALELMENMKI